MEQIILLILTFFIGICLYHIINDICKCSDRINGFSISGNIETLKYMSSEEIHSRFEISVQTYREETYIEVVDKDFYQRYLFDNDKDILVYDRIKNKIFVITELGKVIYNDIEENIIDLLKGEELPDIDPAKFLIERNLEHIIESIRETPSPLESDLDIKRWWEDEKNINFLYLLYGKGCYIQDFDKIKYFTERLSELNKLLKDKCQNLKFKIDNYHRLPGKITSFSGHAYKSYLYKLILCLYYNNDCISSIELVYKGNNTIEINSETHIDHQGKKYNKLLRSAIIYICVILICNTEKITHIESRPIATITSYLLIKNFNVTLEFKNKESKKHYQEVIEEYKKRDEEITFKQIEGLGEIKLITIELTKENVTKAENILDELTDPETGILICPEE